MALKSSSSESTQSAAWVGPTPAGNRIVALDVLRGFALLGILVVNITGFSGVAAIELEWTGLADQAIQGVIKFFFKSKFFSTFTMLFGIGFAI